MNVRLAVAMAVASMALGGCKSPLQKRTPTRIAPLPSDVVRAPALNVDAEAAVGQTLTSSVSQRTACPAIKLAGAVVHPGTGYPSPFVVTIPQGTLYAAARDPSGTFYASPAALQFSQGQDGPTFPVRGGVFVPKASPGATEVYWLDTGGAALNDGHPGLQFEPVTVPVCDRVRRELVLGAVSPRTIRILYRVSVDDEPVPTRSQELTHALAPGAIVELRGAKLQIVSATDAGITYRVLAHLEE